MRGDKISLTRSVGAGIVVLMVASTAAVAGVWWRGFHQRSEPPLGIVIITLDTTRADRLPVYGFAEAAMPHLERLAREGVVFDRATSVAPLTLPAHCSLFTGLFPPAHGVRENADPPLSPDQTTLAETLRAQGFRTGAFVGSVVLDADRGLAQGFDQYAGVVDIGVPVRTAAARRRADEVVTDATHWIDGIEGSRFFLWAHLYDPHRPYDPPEPFRSRYADPYVGEIAFADSQIGRLMEALDRRRLLARTIVVVAGDHGESLGDHGERDHGIFVYESTLHVPLIMRAPHVPSRRIADVVRLVDVMPTVLDLLGVKSGPVDGVSLAAMMHGKARDVELDAYSESLYPQRFGWSSLRALRAGRYKLIDAPRPELYDLERDPLEQRNIYDERRTVAVALARRLGTFGRALAPDSRGAAESPASGDLRQRLASLGYIAFDPPPQSSPDSHLPDAKDCIAVLRNDRPMFSHTRSSALASISKCFSTPSGQALKLTLR